MRDFCIFRLLGKKDFITSVCLWCRSSGDVDTVVHHASAENGSKRTVSNVDLLDGLVTTPPQPVSYFATQPVIGGMSPMYVIGQQPGIVPVVPGSAAGMVQGNTAGVGPNSGTGMMASFPEGVMQGSSSMLMQMNIGMSVQQQNLLSGMPHPATPTSHIHPSQSATSSTLPVSMRYLGSIPKRPRPKRPTVELIMQQKTKTAHRVDQNGPRLCLKRPMTRAKTDHIQNVPSQ